MREGPGDNEDREVTREREQWSWIPRSGEGSGSALGHMKSVERLKARWRQVRARSDGDERPTSD